MATRYRGRPIIKPQNWGKYSVLLYYIDFVQSSTSKAFAFLNSENVIAITWHGTQLESVYLLHNIQCP